MIYRAHLPILALIVLFIMWEIGDHSPDVRQRVRNVVGLNYGNQITPKVKTAAPTPKCGLSTACPPEHFALSLRSGAANVVGPKICFEGKIIISHVLNNVGSGLNVVTVDGENGTVVKFDYLNMQYGNPDDILAYLKEIKPEMIVLVASFDDVTSKMTNEIREVFVGWGSTLIKSLKYRDNWVFVGNAGTGGKHYEEVVSDEKTNIYAGWPEMVQLAGCFPKNQK